jgi:hypothetical protein
MLKRYMCHGCNATLLLQATLFPFKSSTRDGTRPTVSVYIHYLKGKQYGSLYARHRSCVSIGQHRSLLIDSSPRLSPRVSKGATALPHEVGDGANARFVVLNAKISAERRDRNVGNNFAHRTNSSTRGCTPYMAAQQWVGILSKRWPGTGPSDRGGAPVSGPYLTEVRASSGNHKY